MELVGKSYENVSFDLRPILELRLDPLNFNLQDTFGVVSCIECLYAKYEQQLIRMKLYSLRRPLQEVILCIQYLK